MSVPYTRSSKENDTTYPPKHDDDRHIPDLPKSEFTAMPWDYDT
jgi:hypothetical protein